jgi:hypothetical protein
MEVWAISRQCFVYGHKLDHRELLLEAIIVDNVPILPQVEDVSLCFKLQG